MKVAEHPALCDIQGDLPGARSPRATLDGTPRGASCRRGRSGPPARWTAAGFPDSLPKSARDIREVHDLDTNKSMLTFMFDSIDLPDLAASCSQVAGAALRPVPFRRTWWPGDVKPGSMTTHRHVDYRCVYVAVALKEGRPYYWRP